MKIYITTMLCLYGVNLLMTFSPRSSSELNNFGKTIVLLLNVGLFVWTLLISLSLP